MFPSVPTICLWLVETSYNFSHSKTGKRAPFKIWQKTIQSSRQSWISPIRLSSTEQSDHVLIQMDTSALKMQQLEINMEYLWVDVTNQFQMASTELMLNLRARLMRIFSRSHCIWSVHGGITLWLVRISSDSDLKKKIEFEIVAKTSRNSCQNFKFPEICGKFMNFSPNE